MKKGRKFVLLAGLAVGSLVGCGAETVGLALLGIKAAGVVGGGVYLAKSIENVALDTKKKELEMRAIEQQMRASQGWDADHQRDAR